jgi:soluble lytic murein transglycosylase
MRLFNGATERMSSWRFVRGVPAGRAAVTLALFLSFVASSSGQPLDPACASAEDCFRAALARPRANGNGDAAARLQQLELVRERYPGSIWAKRAGLAAGLLLLDKAPAESFNYFRIAQREMPVLEDYARLWLGEALLKEGDARTAADIFEFLPEAVPDSLLLTRVAYRTGESWYKVGRCDKAVPPLLRAVGLGPVDPAAPGALLSVADCHLRDRRPEGLAALKQVWTRYPQTPEAKEAERRLGQAAGEAGWRPGAEDYYGRAQAFMALALHEEAAGDLQKFLAAAPGDPRRNEVRLKLGIALVRLKRYEQAQQVFKSLAEESGTEAGEAAVWLARVYLRLGDGERLVALSQAARQALTPDQKASVLLLVGSWYEDQARFDEALAIYRKILQLDVNGLKADAQWRIGWIHYQTGRYAEAAENLLDLRKKDDIQVAPKAQYWAARSLERLKDRKAADLYLQLCRSYPLTYYCQLVRLRADPAQPVPASVDPVSAGARAGEDSRGTILLDIHYQRALELKLLGMDQEAAREWAFLAERYARDRMVLADLSALLNQSGATSQALRLARVYFRDGLERGGEAVPLALWSVAYPTVHLPTIRAQVSDGLDPYLVAAIIREESQYDPRAVSRVGAIGLMQVMPATAQTLLRRQGAPDVTREELFDQETNIRVGARYLGQLLQQFSGNVVLAVAAYNAGPQAVTGWAAKQAGKEPDEFVELIPYQETRQYVKRVLRSYREYRRLGGASCPVRFLDRSC